MYTHRHMYTHRLTHAPQVHTQTNTHTQHHLTICSTETDLYDGELERGEKASEGLFIILSLTTKP